MMRVPALWSLVSMAMLGGCHLVFGVADLTVDETAVGAGGSGGSSSTGGDAGGSEPECAVAIDCPGIETNCRKRDCDEGVCGLKDQPSGTLCLYEGSTPGVCDGAGECVQCATADECSDPTPVCLNGFCAPLTCENGATDGDETDLDCGGSCPPCANDSACLQDADCESALCEADVCAPCGGLPCGSTRYCDMGICHVKKSLGDVCSAGAECDGAICADGICCNDGCDTICTRCAPDGMSCIPHFPFTDPDSDCPSTSACDGDGACKLLPGESCGMNSHCITDACINFQCVLGP